MEPESSGSSIWADFSRMVRQRRNREQVYSSPQYWDTKALRLNGSSVSMWANQALNELHEREQLGVIQLLLREIEGKAILDVGCGTGRMARHFADRGADVVGIDFSSAAIAIAEKESQSRNCHFRCQSVFEIEDTGAFDIVFGWGVLTVACRDEKDLRNALTRLKRALRPGGVLVLMEPIHSNFLHRVLRMSKLEFAEILTSVGFYVSSQIGLHFWPSRLILCYFNLPMVLTWPIFQAGRVLALLPGFRNLKDYTCIRAELAKDEH
jgi:2-polyprenyl-3-methyl-5-hydroxy-6-metoxy-1,4-benzoquinol methylase